LVQRYLRLRIRNFTIGIARRWLRFILPFRERKRRKLVGPLAGEMAAVLAKCKRNNCESLVVILNIGLFFIVAEKDIQAVSIDAMTHPDPWIQRLSARVILLTIHEFD
jgi:hypothetical protein